MKRILFLLTVAIVILSSCEKQRKHVVVHSYKTQEQIDGAEAVLDVFYYLIENGGDSYYAKSYSPITNFSTVRWSTSPTIKQELIEEKAEELEDQQIETEELSTEIQSDIETNPEGFEDSSVDAGTDGTDGGTDGGSDGGGDGGGGGE